MKNNLLKRTLFTALSVVLVATQLPLSSVTFAADEEVISIEGEAVEAAGIVAVEPESQMIATLTDEAVYLTQASYEGLTEDEKTAYAMYCADAAAYLAEGNSNDGFIAAVNEDGKLIIQMLATYEAYAVEEAEYDEAAAVVSDGALVFAENDEANFDLLTIDVDALYADVEEEEELNLPEITVDDVNYEYDSIDTYMISKTYFYDQLPSATKKLYNKAYKEFIEKGTNVLTYKDKNILKNGVNLGLDAINALLTTYPDKFDWLDRAYVSSTGNKEYVIGSYPTEKKVYIQFDKCEYYTSDLVTKGNNAVSTILTEAKAYAMTNYPSAYTYGLVEYFDKWLCDNNYYDMNGTSSSYMGTAEYYYCHTSFGALTQGVAVCESYALAMSRLLDAAKIPNQYVVGQVPGGGHAWNYVMMPDNNWYLLDTTWNDSTKVGAGSTQKYLLVADDGYHSANGRGTGFYGSYLVFDFYPLATTAYKSGVEMMVDSYVVKGSKVPASEFFSLAGSNFTVANKKIATIKEGIVKAKKVGETEMSAQWNGQTVSSKLHVVDKAKKMSFYNKDGQLTKASKVKSDITKYTTSNQVYYTYKMAVNFKAGAPYTAEQLDNLVKNMVSVTSSDISTVQVLGYYFNGSDLTIGIVGLQSGKATIKTKCLGKTTTINVTVKDM